MTILLVPLLLLVALAAAPTPSATAEEPAVEQRLASSLNQYRREQGLPTLQTNEAATRAARRHARAMLRLGGLRFDRSGEKSLWDRLKEEGVVAFRGQGLFLMLPEAGEGKTAAVDGWLTNPAHRAAILDPGVREIGLGVAGAAAEMAVTAVLFSRPAGAYLDRADLAGLEARLIEGINARRAARGLPALERNPELVRFCRSRAEATIAGVALPAYDRIKGMARGTYQTHWTGGDPVASALAAWGDASRGWSDLWQPEFREIGVGIAKDGGGRLLIAGLVMVRTRGSQMSAGDLRATEIRLTAAINEVRRGHGRESLRVDSRLAAVARSHSEDMARRGYYEHLSPEGVTPRQRLQSAGVDCRAVAENIGRSPTSADPVDEAVDGWMNSPGHRANILNGMLETTGIGVAVDGQGYILYTQVFCRPRNPAP